MINKNDKTMIKQHEKNSRFFAFFGFRLLAFLGADFFIFLSFIFHFFIISFSFFYHFFFIFNHVSSFSSISSWISCVLQLFRPKNEEHMMNTWQNLMNFKQSSKNENKMIKNDLKKCVKQMNKKNDKQT